MGRMPADRLGAIVAFTLPATCGHSMLQGQALQGRGKRPLWKAVTRPRARSLRHVWGHGAQLRPLVRRPPPLCLGSRCERR